MHAFLDVPDESADPAVRFWSASTGAAIGAPWPEHPEFRSLEPATGSRYLHVQRHGGPPRVHLDLTSSDVDAEAARLVELGAAAGVRERWWQVLASPAGLPFCLVAETPGRSRPEPARWPGGHRSRVDQLVLDVPADRYEAERRFWRECTGWPERAEPEPDRHRLAVPRSSPLELLLHRLDDGGGADRGRGHLHLRTDDVPAEVRRLVGLGAVRQAGCGDGVMLAGPAGLAFCVIPTRW